ncbi:succinylglutamate desuccinylase/aspartoacylase family protein [Salinibaculum rarum]|uniref:succinylglutamate desuccinylase/aspartoacylase family protein n=1 Tax=Salinibaculum rarum TaxID=3058903 RepID=UPI00265D981E|nr:succinylglutamate desuccinylase/aspartoacylase family protein [Salinibaculum sp. KK48]
MSTAEAFTYQGGRVDPGETQQLRYTVTETYLGDPVRMPVTIVNGDRPGPTVFLSAAAHGDELNGVEVVREVSDEWDLTDLRGTLVCLPVLNVPGFIAQQRYLPVYDRDLNRSFPGKADSTSAKRMAHSIFANFIAPCDFGLDFHTSTRGRSNMLHVRADMTDDTAARVANAFASHTIIAKQGSSGTLRRAATDAGVPTITVEMGEAHRLEREFIEPALDGVRSVFAEFGLLETETVAWPGWRTVVEGNAEKTWIRADAGGLVDMHSERGTLVYEGEAIATIGDPFGSTSTVVEAPFTGLLIGVAQNPLVYPGNPLCHLVRVDERTQRAIERNST